jgi:hypothetical protein
MTSIHKLVGEQQDTIYHVDGSTVYVQTGIKPDGSPALRFSSTNPAPVLALPQCDVMGNLLRLAPPVEPPPALLDAHVPRGAGVVPGAPAPSEPKTAAAATAATTAVPSAQQKDPPAPAPAPDDKPTDKPADDKAGDKKGKSA